MDISPSSVVEYKDGELHRLALILDLGKALRVLRGDNQTVMISQKALTFGPLPPPTPPTAAALQALEDRIDALAQGAQLGDAWELLEGQPATLEELSDLVAGGVAPHQRLATLRALRLHPHYFKLKKDLYEPRAADQVKEMQTQREAEEATRRQRERFAQALQGVLDQGEDHDPAGWLARRAALAEAVVDPELRQRLLLLEEYAVQGDEFERARQADALLEQVEASGFALQGKQSERAWGLLVRLGRFSPHENLALRRAEISLEPDEAFEALGAALARPADATEAREDALGLEVWTIDAASTRDIDDGLSVRALPEGGAEVGIHIADPDHWLPEGHALDALARARGTSVYLPEGVVPMLPRALSDEAASLHPGELRPALSFFVSLDADLEIIGSRVALTWVRSRGRLTYEEVDAILSGEQAHAAAAALGTLSGLARRRLAWRVAQGAVIFRIPEPAVQVRWADRAAGAVEAVEVFTYRDTPSRDLVQEMMILAGELAGRYCKEAQLPVIYRSQPAPEDGHREEALKGKEHDLVASFQYRRWMRRGELGLAPARHFGLGVEGYAQATSPIRRYADLICHRQIKAHLRGQAPPYDAEALSALAPLLDARGGEASALERDGKRYWTQVHLQSRKGELLRGRVVEVAEAGKGRVSVVLEELGYVHYLSARHQATLGEELWLRIDSVDPRRDQLSARVVTG
jgi:exoribonuclease-2